ncbi:SMI1/KNR4 family protein [Streptomyces sp. M3]|uniref:SMI1/KNR4 family protein n=1 Tax=Streptomyces sp. M3 TaxID=295102 RepID=UPI00100DC68D|nr:SMI1/KNR4 family protein [Streptomyces sp. M3]
MTDTGLAAFNASWDRFASWLCVHSPLDHAALRSPATAEEIAALEARLRFPLHPQLRALLERHNGVMVQPAPDNFHAGAFLPRGHRLNDTEHIARQHEWLVGAGAELIAGDARNEESLYGHAHQWVPFAHPNDGGIAFIDHRPGPTYGRVYEMGIGSGAIAATQWASSLSELFDDLATSLDTGEPFQQSWPTPYKLPSAHFCLTWDSGNRRKSGDIQAWPPPRPLDSPLRSSSTTRRRLGRPLGTLIPPSALQAPRAAAQELTVPIGPFHTSRIIVKDSENSEDTDRRALTRGSAGGPEEDARDM